MRSLQGKLLVSSPFLPDANFSQTVVLLVQHHEDGALGLVLNRPSSCTIAEIWQEALGAPCDSKQHVDLGGPCQGPLMCVHTHEAWSEQMILPGVYFSTDRHFLEQIVARRDRPFRVFSGYSGWAGGQLEGELEEGSWLVTPASYKLVFAHDEHLWRHTAHSVGREILFSSLGVKTGPDDPTLN